eukprot:m.750543 g.750543  ORF g.750543 m.750543 type:complete len:328 (-) comp23160_c0_seq1:600-1583(-)
MPVPAIQRGASFAALRRTGDCERGFFPGTREGLHHSHLCPFERASGHRISQRSSPLECGVDPCQVRGNCHRQPKSARQTGVVAQLDHPLPRSQSTRGRSACQSEAVHDAHWQPTSNAQRHAVHEQHSAGHDAAWHARRGRGRRRTAGTRSRRRRRPCPAQPHGHGATHGRSDAGRGRRARCCGADAHRNVCGVARAAGVVRSDDRLGASPKPRARQQPAVLAGHHVTGIRHGLWRGSTVWQPASHVSRANGAGRLQPVRHAVAGGRAHVAGRDFADTNAARVRKPGVHPILDGILQQYRVEEAFVHKADPTCWSTICALRARNVVRE